MINFNNLEIVRARMHKVHSKFSINRDTAEVEYLEDAFTLDEDIKEIIRDRLLQSFGTQGKSFELSIEDESDDSCFAHIKDLNHFSDHDFYETSKVIAVENALEKVPDVFTQELAHDIGYFQVADFAFVLGVHGDIQNCGP